MMQALQNVLVAAEALLSARDDQILTALEWEALSTSIANARSLEQDSPTYAGCLEVWTDACAVAADAALRKAGVQYVKEEADRPQYDVGPITAGQYAAVIDALHEAGEAGIDWNFPLD
jgi:hypothetical protein